MKTPIAIFAFMSLIPGWAAAQDKFSVSGTPIPAQLLTQNYGSIPKGITGYDINICNVSEQKASIISSQIYQALAQTNVSLRPIGRQMMLASILQNERRSTTTILKVALSSATGIVALLSTSNSLNAPNGLKAAIGLSSILLNQITSDLKPVMAPDKVEKFDREVLESALILDGGSCVERTVFATSEDAKAKPAALSFHVR